MGLLDSDGLYRQQSVISVTRNLTEEEHKTAPLISLADKEKLQDVSEELRANESRVRSFRSRVEANLPPEAEDTAQAGPLVEAESVRPVSDAYISVTSGFDITSLEKELLTKWKYQRFNGRDTADMVRLKDSLKEVTSVIASTAVFKSLEDVREKSREAGLKYLELIRACERYLETHKSPRTIAGIARKDMAGKLVIAARAEYDLLENSAINCFREMAGRLLEPEVSLTWDEILHQGRARIYENGRAVSTVEYPNEHKIEIKHRRSKVKDILTVARDEEELEQCRKVVAVSRLAERLGCGELAGGGTMNTRMATAVVNGKAMTGVITTGMTMTTPSEFSVRNMTPARPGSEAFEKPETVKGADYLMDETALKILDYLTGASKRKDDLLACAKQEKSGYMVLGHIQAGPETVALKGFSTDEGTVPALKGAAVDPELADSILSLNKEDLPDLFAGMIGSKEIEAVGLRLDRLKKEIEENRATFVTKEALEKSIEEQTSAGQAAPETGKLMPLSKLVAEIGTAKGKQAEDLNGFIKDMPGCIERFIAAGKVRPDFSKGREAVLRRLDTQFLALRDLEDFCRGYLKISRDDGDAANRFAVGKLLAASVYQGKCYREHVEAVCDWYHTIRQDNHDWDLSLSFGDLFRESMIKTEHHGLAGSLSEDEIYSHAGLSMEELCERTESPCVEGLERELAESMRKKAEAGETNSDEIDILHDSLFKMKKLMGYSAQSSVDRFIGRMIMILEDIQAYEKKQGKKLLGGKGSSMGRDRARIVSDIEDLINEEYGRLFVKKKNELDFEPNTAVIQSYTEKCAKELGIPEVEVTFGDIFRTIKREELTETDKQLMRGISRKAKVVKEREEVKEAKKAKKAGTAPKDRMSEVKRLEGELADKLEQPALHSILTALDEDLVDTENSKEITDYAGLLRQLVEFKDEPVFSEKLCRAYKGDEGSERMMGDELIARHNAMVEIIEKVTKAHEAYLNKPGTHRSLKERLKKLRAGSIRKKLVTAASEAYHWEFDQFIGVDAHGEKRIMREPLLKAVHELLDSGMELKDITFTDLTNQARIHALEAKGKKK